MQRPNNERLALLHIIRSAARKSMCDEVRKRGLSKSLVEVRKLANRHLVGSAKAKAVHLRAEEINSMGRSMAIWLRDNHDPSKTRKPARIDRAERAAVDNDVIREFVEAKRMGAPISVRELAARHGLSKSRVQRALMSHGSDDLALARDLSAMARRVLAVIHMNAPIDGKRAFDRDEIFDVAGVEGALQEGVIAEINEGRISTHLLQTEIVSGFGSTWIIVSRGRKPPNAKLLTWLANAEITRTAGNRRQARPDQKKYCIDLALPIAGLVERDLWCAVAVLRESWRNLATWRHFIEVSLPARSADGRPIDRGALVTVVQSISRLEKDAKDLLPIAVGWPILAAMQEEAQELILQIQELWAFSDRHGEVELLCHWAKLVRYEERVKDGSLPGRSLNRFQLLTTGEALDREEIFWADEEDEFRPGGSRVGGRTCQSSEGEESFVAGIDLRSASFQPDFGAFSHPAGEWSEGWEDGEVFLDEESAGEHEEDAQGYIHPLDEEG